MKPSKSKSVEADYLTDTLPIIIGIALFIKFPVVVIVAATLVEIVIKCILTAFTGLSEDLRRDGKVGAATYLLYPLIILWSVAWRLVAAIVMLFLAAIGVVFLVVVVMAVVATVIWVGGGLIPWNDNAIYTVLMSEILKAIALGASLGLNIFIRPMIVGASERLMVTVDSLKEGVLVSVWLAILAIAVVSILFTPILWPFDIPQLLSFSGGPNEFGGSLFGWTH